MPDEPVTRSSTSYYTKRMDEAKRTLGLPAEATLDDLLKKIINGGMVEMDREQWWAYGRKFYEGDRA